ncbi:MAG: HTTM domain-containing protein [Reichenbachiella sp.]|uniref:HTTM domain-containing protein n=1 Tax=Reichenbachiella sp. TaxID=2184521 RepID=UPI003265E809
METDLKVSYWQRSTSAAPLAVFRILFGGLMFVGVVRFWLNGWIEKLYIEPQFFFSYYGFEWIKPLGSFTYFIFILCGISALLIALGYKYRMAIVVFFLSFTYIELMDKTTYLNHYYFVSLISFILIFLPANCFASLDVRSNPNIRFDRIPKWNIDCLKLMLGIVYFYAGLAKINSDWLIEAMPLKIWLPGGYDLPILGYWLQQAWVHYLLSWVGMLYDLSVPFLLLYATTRWYGYTLVVIFHVLTSLLFPIGMFPYLMIACTLIFFSPQVHLSLLSKFRLLRPASAKNINAVRTLHENSNSLYQKIKMGGFIVFFALQLAVPFRYLLYPDELFWTEEGFRFSWRVMLMEKAGATSFKVQDGNTDKRFYVENSDFLTSFQEKQMSFQPDFILEYAHHLEKHYRSLGYQNIEIYVDSFVALNGRPSKRYIDPTVDLTKVKESFKHKNWILPFDDEIKGL